MEQEIKTEDFFQNNKMHAFMAQSEDKQPCMHIHTFTSGNPGKKMFYNQQKESFIMIPAGLQSLISPIKPTINYTKG